MRVKIGERIGAILSATNDTVSFLGYGKYVGNEVPPEFPIENPKLQLDNGQTVWGYQCWWASEYQTKQIIGNRKVIMVTVDSE